MKRQRNEYFHVVFTVEYTWCVSRVANSKRYKIAVSPWHKVIVSFNMNKAFRPLFLFNNAKDNHL